MADRALIRGTGALPVRINQASHGRGSRVGEGVRRGFSLTELLVVLGVILLILAVAVPAVNLLTGQRSIAVAQNQLAAVLAQARGRALALQRETGLFFYLDPTSDRFAMRTIEVVGRQGSVQVIDLVLGTDGHLLPGGVGVQFPVAGATGSARTAQGYVGFNRLGGSQVPVGGAILFDRQGRLLIANCVAVPDTALGKMLGASSNIESTTHLGVVLFERGPFADRFTFEDPSSGYPANEREEETWLDENGHLLLINRYSGTFVE